MQKEKTALPAGYYDEIYRERHGMRSAWHRLKFLRVKQVMGTYTSHFDVGCSAGTFISTLDPDRVSIGVDVDEAQIEYAKRQYGIGKREFYVLHARNELAFDDNQCDIVTVIEVIEHLPQEDALFLLRQAVRILRPGGRLIISTPNYASLWPAVEWCVDQIARTHYRKEHVTRFTKKKLNDLLATVGLQNISIQSYQTPLVFLAGWGRDARTMVNKIEKNRNMGCCGLLLIAQGYKT